MKLIRTGTYAIVEGDRELAYTTLDPHFSYAVPGAKYSPAYRAKRRGKDGKVTRVWDGRKRLIRRIPNTDRLIFPAGLFSEAEALLTKAKVRFEAEDRSANALQMALGGPRSPWEGPTLFPHQAAAVAAVLGHPGAFRQGGVSGVLVMPIGSGKTATAAYLAQHLGYRTCFVAPSDFLVQQALDAFRTFLPKAHITAVGGGQGEDITGQIVIASMATLQARCKTPWFQSFRTAFGLVFCDEHHHAVSHNAGDWRETMLQLDAPIKIGLTATLDDEDPGVSLWARGICGPVLYEVEMKTLIDQGYLAPGLVRFLRHDGDFLKKAFDKTKWSKQTYSHGVVKCDDRNRALVNEAARLAKEGHRVVCDVAQIGHTRAFADLLRRQLPPGKVVVLTGSSTDEERTAAVQGLRRRDVWVIVGTLLGEGVDIPELSVVVNVEGGKASASATQRLRNLRKHPDKPIGIVVESFDTHHATLALWCLERVKLYRRLGLKVEVEKKESR